jgi:pSer/pThr/pTyr-binding forkhead associated (FHA) protein
MNRFSIGRSTTNDLHVNSAHVSFFHARLVQEMDGLYIEHVSATPGVNTYVNGEPVIRRRVSPGDRVELSRAYTLDWNHPAVLAWLSDGGGDQLRD